MRKRKRERREREGGGRSCKECPTGERESRKNTKIPAGSGVLLPESPIGLSLKAGIREKDWKGKGERKTE